MPDLSALRRDLPALPLSTRSGRPIPNSPAPEPGERELALWKRECARHARWQPRRGACGVYNCWGMLWAARRTSIWKPEVADSILAEEYQEIDCRDLVPGDLVAYYSPAGEFIHAATVVEMRSGTGALAGLSRQPWLLSKWSAFYGESFHELRDVVFAPVYPDFQLRFWTDRTT
ncbi:MAG: hypothetical protein AB7K09_24460 [Planctomycetota bacterium]